MVRILADMNRRNFLVGAILASAPVSTRAALAQLMMPVVDELTLQVIDDSATFGPFLSDTILPGLQVRRHSGDAGAAVMSRRALHAEFGLSILATSRREENVAKILVDFGYSPEAMRNNIAMLDVDMSDLDAAVLSHGHLDHYGGFSGVFGEAATPAVPLYVGGEEAFCDRLALIGTPPPRMGALDRDALAAAGFRVQIVNTPTIIKGQAFTTGEIPLSSWERAAIPTQMRPGHGCDVAGLEPVKRNSMIVADDGAHELGTCYLVKGLGLIVIASCSHRGLINTVRQAKEISGVEKVHAVVGGFHLVRPRTEEEARRTVAELIALDVTYIVPMHCTGEVFVQEAIRLAPDKVIRTYVGTELSFSV